ncbi:hypothetical protein BH23CHL8_BH23CHL8_14740 [soil metagenome]
MMDIVIIRREARPSTDRRAEPSRRSRRSLRRAGPLVLVCALSVATIMPVEDVRAAAEATPGACSPPVLAVPGTETPAAGASPGAEPSDDASPAASPATAIGGPDLSRGTWARMANAQFGSEYEPVVWTGTRMVAVDSDTGRTAVYRPAQDRWREVAPAPRRFDATARDVWTGRELIILEVTADEAIVDGLAYRPGSDRWRKTARLRTDADGETDHALVDAAWTGTHVVVVDSLGLVAAYDPTGDCWVELERVPGEPWAWRLYAAGPWLLVESRRRGEPVEMRALDPATGTWSEPSVGPLDRSASEGGGMWIDGRLVYVSWYGAMDDGGVPNAVFDPVTMSWSAFEHDCGTRASGSVQVESFIVASDGRRALDGRTFACIDLPAPPRRLNGTERMVWTGHELIAWSGIKSLPEGPRRGGLVFRHPTMSTAAR